MWSAKDNGLALRKYSSCLDREEFFVRQLMNVELRGCIEARFGSPQQTEQRLN